MKFTMIAYKYLEDTFYNIAKEKDVDGIEEGCLIPSEKLANQIIEDELSEDYVPVEVKLLTLDENGTFSYELGKVEKWKS